jgi:2-polyprenyl-3-methyl-5-hydroxy-6-metoxy-1,4-benzoquinol methylase
VNKTEKFWDRLSSSFDQSADDSAQPYNKTIEKTKKYLNAGDIVLDYGCATGGTSLQVAGYVKEVHGVDISSKMIAAAERKAADRNIENVEFAKTTIFDERYQQGSFDVILAFNILHLLEDTPVVLQRINQLLKPGGLMISETACLREKALLDRLIFFLLFLVTKIGIIPYVKFFSTSELEDSIAKGGLRIVETERLTNSPMSYFIVAKKM